MAATPEQLMRSRYTAYSMANILYIKSTMRGKAAQDYDETSAAIWARTVKWLELTVVTTEMAGEDKGFVEFIVKYSYEGMLEHIHEKSEFHLIKGVWYYVDGDMLS
ncbi:MAG: YchJ family metal-binding protein [Gammaproteobacteria bacterium]|nr:YchJ family metal-binding protein [Gammaproteobacteria bacterium]